MKGNNMNTKKQLLQELSQNSPWLLVLTGALVLAFKGVGQSITLAFVPLILYWGLHWAVYFVLTAITSAMSKIDKRLIDAERGRDISTFTYRTFMAGMGICASCFIIAGFSQPWWTYVMALGLLVWGMGLGMMFPRFITHTEKRPENNTEISAIPQNRMIP